MSQARRWIALVAVLSAASACSPSPGSPSLGSSVSLSSTHVSSAPGPSPVRLVFVGDVMLGRGVAPVAAAQPDSVFERLRPVLVGADLAFANLESPLTDRAHVGTGFALEADPATAALLAGAGFDVVDIANNHALDAGPETVADTIAAVTAAGLRTVGAGADHDAATAPLIESVHGIRIGVLAFDLTATTGAGPSTPGVHAWHPAAAEAAVRALRADADLVVVGVHGGVEYLPRPDPVLAAVTEQLVSWGADVVWGHGAHVRYPVTISAGVRPAAVAPGLGNALFDQRLPGTDTGTALEVLADDRGVIAMRTGTVSIESGRATFVGWDDPAGDAVALDGEWWTPVRPVAERAASDCAGTVTDAAVAGLPRGSTVVTTGCGRVSGTGDEIVVSYRRPTTTETLQAAFPGHRWTDSDGLSAHVAVMEPDGAMHWGAATLLDPIGEMAVCTGSLALGFTTLDDPTVIAAGAWTWRGFGFRTAPMLPGPSSLGCADVDHDGATEPVIRRSIDTQEADS